ncbi:histidine protein methyltransferase 1 homolog [Drosophila tropicalis]|uniref:histidine protein methyltransferase 1 homolog n=1 Tax=Drosophila tropicalis TaxID=46794 RepID=UPI0035ABBCD4
MFKFNFHVDAETSDTAFDLPKEDKTPENERETKEEVIWYQSEQVKPTEALLTNIDLYELNAKDLKVGNIELRHLIAGFVLEDIKTHQDGDSTDIKKSEDEFSDLITGVYEGGAKMWEGTDDILLYLAENFKDSFWKDKHVLDLGCGSGLLGIYAVKCGAQVDFQDYNKDVLENITQPNVVLNLKDAFKDDEKLKFLEENTKFFAGDWSHFSLLTKDLNKYDIILTAETIYNIENQQKLIDTFSSRLKSDGLVLVAAKSHYFGVGGGLEQFIEVIRKNEIFESKNVWHTDENLKRGILELKFK